MRSLVRSRCIFSFACSLILHSARPARRHHLILRRDFTAERFLSANFFCFFFLSLSLIRRGLPAHLWLVFRPVMSAERGWQLLRLRRPRRKSQARNIYRERERAGARLYLCTRGLRLFSQSAPRPTDQPKDQPTNSGYTAAGG